MSSSGCRLLLLLMACIAVVLVNGGELPESDRSKFISEAIEEVKNYETMVKTSSVERKISRAQKKLHGFKMATPASLAHGKAQLRFERMVKIAEKKIIQKQRQVTAQDSMTKAESLAFELLHRPGKLLTSQEIARISSESGCREAITVARYSCRETLSRLFRTANGTCNNFVNPTFGAAGTGFRRLIQARYDDGIFRARGFLQSTGSSLFLGPFSPPAPSARLVSTSVVLDRPINDTKHTHILMQWGQFIDHDMDLTPEHEAEECPAGCKITEEEEGSCYPIRVLEDDNEVLVTRASSDSPRCEPFMRSLAVCMSQDEVNNRTGNIPPKEQINAITSFIDGSMVYHHDPEIQRTLIRNTSSNAGLLRVGSPISGTTQDTLPFIDIVANPGIVACPNPPCFLAGDVRVNEQIALTVMHTIWLREHNRIARILKQLNPTYSGELLFLTTRTIVSGMIQKITYEDFLPEILGSTLYDSLIPPFTGYNSSIDPSVPNAFATAAYRFGHSLIQPAFNRLNKNYQSIQAGPLNLLDAFFDSSALANSGGTDTLLRGLLEMNSRKVDEFVNKILTNRLFADNSTTPGLDLASLNVQRGRDHGLATYLTWKQWAKDYCGLESDFRSDLTGIRLLQTYGGLNDVDLFIGGLAEEPIPGGIVGATFSCIFSKTFTAVRDGDRFYYENIGAAGRFTRLQLAQIKKASLSRVICDNSDDITEVQRNAFLSGQSRVPCSQIPSVNLNAWKASNGSCSMRVISNTAGEILAISRLGSLFHYSKRTVYANRPACIQFECPTSSISTRLGMSFSPSSANCRFIPNSNLPSSSRNLLYLASISSKLVQSSNGLHRTAALCSSGSAVGMKLFCTGSSSSASVQSNQDIDVDADDSTELGTVVGDDGQELLDAVDSTSGKTEKNLISLMENVLAQLQETKKEKKDETETDKDVMSQLENYFKSN